MNDKFKSILNIFIKNFIISGVVIGIFSVLMELISVEFVGFLHGALPLTFTYLVFMTYYTYPKKVNNFTLLTGLSGFLWVFFLLFLYFLLKLNINLYLAYFISIIVFVIMCYLFYLLSKKCKLM